MQTTESREGRGPRVEVHELDSPEATLELAAALARRLPGGSVVHLHGDLGAGKTVFAKGLAAGLGLDPADVLSPTFTLVHPHAPAHEGGLGFVHVDLYRVADPAELEELGLTELPGQGAVAAVEWAERLGGRAAAGALRVTLEDLDETRRRVTVAWPAKGTRPPGCVVA